MREDGGVRVVNRGFDEDDQEWSEATGKAYFVSEPDLGRLKVSFFGPFYGGYNIMALDRDGYQWALIGGNDTDYLWILSRTPTLEPVIYEDLLARAAAVGFPVEDLILVEHGER
jgi:apolipoprotein D and lipocalin family protein